MPLNQSTLETGLLAMVPTPTEIAAINAFATAFETYFYEASVAGMPATPGTLAPATTSMKGAMAGMSLAASGAMAAGITAFWSTVTGSAPIIWITVPPIVSATAPPGLSGIAAALESAFAANTAAKADLATSMSSIAAAIHGAQSGGVAVLGPPPPGGTPTPIL